MVCTLKSLRPTPISFPSLLSGIHSCLKSLQSFCRFTQAHKNAFAPQFPILQYFKSLEKSKEEYKEHLYTLYINSLVINLLTHLLSLYICIYFP